MADERKLNITKFLGLYSDDAGDTDIPVGALSQLQNFQVLPSRKLRKRSGYSSLLAEPFGSPVRGHWYGKLGDKMFHVAVAGGEAYVIDKKDKIHIGSLEDAPTNIFQFNNTIYIQNGVEYYKFTGEEVVNPNEVNFDSKDDAYSYPKTITLPAGKYEFILGGGKGKDESLGSSGTAYGGKGGTIRFRVELSAESDVRIEKITVNGEYGASFWVYVDNVLHAAVGGGAGPGWRLHTSLPYPYTDLTINTGHGGSEQGMDGNTDPEGGKGANLSVPGVGGTNRGPSGNWKTDAAGPGLPGYGPDAGANKGKGGLGGTSHNHGGCGYAGGGGGAYTQQYNQNTGADRAYLGQGGGGSSYVIETDNLTLFENSRGTNNGVAFVEILTVRPYGLLTPVEGAIPKVYTSRQPDGTNATKLEPINALTPKRRQTFNGNGSATVYKLAEKNNTSVDKVLVGGVEKTVTTHYTVNASNDEVTFASGNIPSSGLDNVEIQYTHDGGTDRAEVTKYTNARIYGGKNDNRVFFYGNGNRIIYSDLADGVPSVEYFPVVNTMDVGSTQYDVTGLSVQYDRMLIHKERGTWWTSYDYDADLLMANFPVYPLNDNVGQTYKGVEQICENNPFVLQNRQLWQFVASNVRDERNVNLLSERVQPLLDEIDFSNVSTIDYEKYGEYWIINGRRIYIYNYRIDAWFYYYMADEVTSAIVMDEKIAIGTVSGGLYLMDGTLDDNGELINAFAETGWIDYGISYMRKFLNFMWVQIFPESNTSVDVHYQIDRSSPKVVKVIDQKGAVLHLDVEGSDIENVKEIVYNNIDFDNIDFSDFSFFTNYNPKSFRLKPKAKKFVYIKFTFVNDKRTRLTLLGLNAPALIGGRSK